MNGTFEFVGNGTLSIEGEEKNVEMRFTGKQKELNENEVTFELVEKDGTWIDYIIVDTK